ncbi:MAG: PIG-L deacetylase family protein [Anaerolineales bacterium]
MKYIFLSPHFDDVVFSCGGLIWELTQRGDDVAVWTITTAKPNLTNLSPFAAQLHQRWGSLLDAVDVRMAEDSRAAQILGFRQKWFPVLDCIYRRAKDGTFLYDSESSLFGDLNPEDDALIEWLANELKALRKSKVQLISPLGVGHHVDHQLTRKAAEASGLPLWFYAEVPYILKHADWQTKWLIALSPVLNQTISPQAVHYWQKAAAAYASQISTFWSDEIILQEDLQRLVNQGWGGFLWG